MDFFRINMPYGISKNENDEWMAFNREYLPLGYSKQPEKEFYHVLERKPINLSVYNKYYGLTEKILLQLAATETSVKRDEKGKICVVWFYNDASNPTHQQSKSDKKYYFERYFGKLQLLAEKSVKNQVNNFF